jgi:hypothetical protein
MVAVQIIPVHGVASKYGLIKVFIWLCGVQGVLCGGDSSAGMSMGSLPQRPVGAIFKGFYSFVQKNS